jgi:predicted ATPase
VRCVVHATAARTAARAGSRTRGESNADGAKTFDVAVALVKALHAIAPAALIVEDLHWADEATLDVVRLLARKAEDAGLLLVLSYRSDQLHRDHPLRIVLGELPSGDTVTRLELSTLAPETVGELAAEAGLDAGHRWLRTRLQAVAYQL